MDLNILINIVTIAPPLLVAVILHEIAHGWVAGRLGDPTAKNEGRITLNPIKHIDPVMTILLPAVLILSGSPIIFGGAKPVPVNPRNFKDPRRGMLWVALAGPITNFILAGLSYLLLILTDFSLEVFVASGLVSKGGDGWLMGFAILTFGFVVGVIQMILAHSILINIVLAIFNLIPVPPLDGGRVMVGILPLDLARKWAKLERFGLIILILILYSGFVQKILEPIIEFVFRHIAGAG